MGSEQKGASGIAASGIEETKVIAEEGLSTVCQS
jgi:hypothetical protein